MEVAVPAAAITAKSPEKLEGKYKAMVLCWLLGIGCLFSWNSMLSIQDYYVNLFPNYHPARVLTLVYQPFAFITLALDLGTSGKGGIGPFIGVCVISAAFGLADAHVQGGMVGDLSFMQPEIVQSFLAGLAASGAIISGLRMITKGVFDSSQNGLRKGAILFFALCTTFELLCVLLYAFVFPKLPIVKYYRAKAASEGSKTVSADLAAAGIHLHSAESAIPERLTNRQLIAENIDYALDMFLIYLLTLSIFPGFLSEDTGKHSLGSWYAIFLIAMYNVWDLIGRNVPLIECVKLESRRGLKIAVLARFFLIPAFYFTAKYADQGWMIFLTSFLGLTNGYLTVCVLTSAPKGYKGPEQNALGNILVLFLVGGIFSGVISDWLWLIGKDLERFNKQTDQIEERHEELVKDLVQSGLVYTGGVAIALGIGAKTNFFHETPSCVGFCGFLLAKILREYYWVRTVFGIIGAWMAAALSLTLPMHMALDTTYHVLIVIGMFIMTMVPLASMAVLQANKIKARKAERPVIGVVPVQAAP
ncbi:Equilibrative nucleoside transporter [Artemisia annua]|uniref:Equilibrative nucleoside transporter n=1 Tax=Artemisia annua TaxID=35608 RepID=A0A2U1LY89_ARTAN|nr:Equilibrative nucleoside transporter [Artemisia annua]